MGKICYINLTKKEIKEFQTPNWLTENYVGGLGILCKLLYDNISKDISYFDEKNIIGIASGPYNGPYSGRCIIASKSPLTKGWGESHIGGKFGMKLRDLGIDAILINGKSKEKSSLIINEDKIEIQGHKGTTGIYDTVKKYKNIHGNTASVLTIGEGGDSLVRFAAISEDGKNYAARGGLGAVLGSKKLKALVIPPTKAHNLSKGDYVKQMGSFRKKNLNKYGTSNILSFKVGKDFPTKNFTMKDFAFEYSCQEISSIKKFIENHKVSQEGCPKCPVKCKINLDLNERTYQIPEYEAFNSLGANAMNKNVESIAKLNELCNDYGLDVISTGGAISFFIEAAEKGLIKENYIDKEIKEHLYNNDQYIGWDNLKLEEILINKMVTKEGIGSSLAEGPYILEKSEIFTDIDKAKDIYIHVKGVSPNGTDPRTHPSHAIAFATSAMGATHLEKMIIYDEGCENLEKLYCILGKRVSLPEAIKYSENISTMSDTLVFCKHLIQSLKNITPQIINGLLKETLDKNLDYEPIASRITDLRRLFNIEHRGVVDDYLPKRFFEPLSKKHLGINKEWFKNQIEEYYSLRGWNSDGTLREERIQELRNKKINLEE